MRETEESLLAQTYRGEWEWVVVPNQGAVMPQDMCSACRAVPYEGKPGIGAIKHFACSQARGDIIVELDHDDLLTPRALELIAGALESADFCYSNFAEFEDGTWEPHVYDPAYGWATRKAHYYGHDVQELRAFEPDARSMSSVHWAPNHVRAWKTDAYWDVGGHDESLSICDDHDLVCRFYLKKRMKHIDECLYLYRLHGDNSYLRRNAAIQKKTVDIRRQYLWPMAMRQAELADLPKVDLGSYHGKPDGYVGVDIRPGPKVDKVCDVSEGLPFPDNSVGLVRAMDFLEHIPDSVGLMNEIWRVLADGAFLLSGTPSTDGRGAWQDPTHVSFWNENNFWYYTDRGYAQYVDGIKCRFQKMRVETYFPTGFHRKHDIPYVYADLAAIKDNSRRPGQVLI